MDKYLSKIDGSGPKPDAQKQKEKDPVKADPKKPPERTDMKKTTKKPE